MPRFSKERKSEIEAAIKKKVLDAVFRILTKSDSARITITMLAEESAVSRGTLYNYFKDKDEIVAYVVEQAFSPTELKQIEIVESDMSALDKLRAIMNMRITRNTELLEMVVMLTNNMSVPETSRPAVVLKAFRKRIITRLEGVIADGVKEGLFRNIDMQFMVSDYLAIAKHKNISKDALSGRDPKTVEKDVEGGLDIFMYGTALRRWDRLPGVRRSYVAVVGNTPKDCIFAAVVTMLKDYSLDNLSTDLISMNMIAKHAGMSKAGLYKHFKSKDDLLAYVVRKSLEPHENAKMECVKSNISIPEKLVEFAAAEINKNDNMKRVNNITLWNKFTVSSCYAFDELRQRSSECITEIMIQGLREGFFRKIDAKDLVSLFEYLVMVFFGYKTYYEKKEHVAMDASMVVDVFLNGVAAR